MRCSGILPGFSSRCARAERDVGRLVLGQHDLLVAAHDLGGALHDDPMLGAVVVHLQRQLGARLHHDVLDLDAVAAVDRAGRCPTGDAPVGWRRRARCAPSRSSRATSCLTSWVRSRGATSTASAVATTTRSSTPSAATSPCFGAQIAIARVLGDDIAGERHCRRRPWRRSPTARPRSRHRSSPSRPAPPRRAACAPSPHSRSRSFSAAAKAVLSRRRKSRSRLPRSSARRHAASIAGSQPLELAQIERRREQEDAAVPEIIAGGDIGARRGRGRASRRRRRPRRRRRSRRSAPPRLI